MTNIGTIYWKGTAFWISSQENQKDHTIHCLFQLNCDVMHQAGHWQTPLERRLLVCDRIESVVISLLEKDFRNYFKDDRYYQQYLDAGLNLRKMVTSAQTDIRTLNNGMIFSVSDDMLYKNTIHNIYRSYTRLTFSLAHWRDALSFRDNMFIPTYNHKNSAVFQDATLWKK